jgi:energy-coupling factor transport system ATP-binding protein
MFAAMPTPVQVYYGVPNDNTCPLTVREGGDWLSKIFEDKTPEVVRIEDADGSHEEISGILDPENEDCALVVKEAWFRYEKDAPDILKGVSFRVPRGSLFAIVGGNGTGKSTTLKAICDICKPYRGKIFVEGKQIGKYKSGKGIK